MNTVISIVRMAIFGLHISWVIYSIALVYLHSEFVDRWPVWLYMTGLFFASFILTSMIYEKTLPMSEKTDKNLKGFVIMFRYMLYATLALIINVIIRAIFS